jgi:hypothetical protein
MLNVGKSLFRCVILLLWMTCSCVWSVGGSFALENVICQLPANYPTLVFSLWHISTWLLNVWVSMCVHPTIVYCDWIFGWREIDTRETHICFLRKCCTKCTHVWLTWLKPEKKARSSRPVAHLDLEQLPYVLSISNVWKATPKKGIQFLHVCWPLIFKHNGITPLFQKGLLTASYSLFL